MTSWNRTLTLALLSGVMAFAAPQVFAQQAAPSARSEGGAVAIEPRPAGDATPRDAMNRPAAPASQGPDQGAAAPSPGRATAAAAAQQRPVALTDTMEEADRDMKRVLEAHGRLGARPLEFLTPEEARRNPTIADAVKAVVRAQGNDPVAMMAAMGVSKKDMTYPVAGGTQPVRVYTPQGAAPGGGFPVIVYYHGGGWVIADIDTYEASTMALAKKANAVVVSVEYRHAPENKFPAAHEDAVAAYRWSLENAGSFGGDPRRVAVAGESAGGNLAANVAIAARDQNLQSPAHMLLVYPIAGGDVNTQSYRENATATPLNKGGMLWFFDHYLRSDGERQDPRINLVAANLRGLPSATVIAAELDPLRSEGKELADKLRAAGSEVTYQLFDGVTHEFFGADAVLADAGRAQNVAVRDLREALAEARPPARKGRATGQSGAVAVEPRPAGDATPRDAMNNPAGPASQGPDQGAAQSPRR